MARRDPRTSPNARFLRGDALVATAPGGSLQRAFSVSVLTHASGFLLLALLVSRLPGDTPRSTMMSNTPPLVVWLPHPGVLRGGGGSDGAEREAARKAELPGRRALTVPAVKSESSRTDTLNSEEGIRIPAVAMMADSHEVPGILTTLSLVPTVSQGQGTGDRGGQGHGTGSGPGDGPGLGPGRWGGMGGEAYQVGSGVVGPRLIKEMKPAYTAEAMRARVQGTVRLEAIVLPDGSVGPVRVVRSLDTTFGLDAEAVTAVKAWRFMPGTLAGRAVPVLVNIELAFTLR